MWVRAPPAFPNTMKLSKLEAYRIYELSHMLWPLVLRFNGDTAKIQEVLDRAWAEYYSHISKCPHSIKLAAMKIVIESSPLLQKYLPKQ